MIPRKTLTAIRKIGTRINGKFIVSSEETFSIIASVQPASGTELDISIPFISVEKGDIFKLITNDALTVLRDGNDADYVMIGEKECRVIQAKEWNNNIMNHNIYFVQEVI
jgi:hypothetical protein